MLILDRSRYEATWHCSRRRFLEYDHLGSGIRPKPQEIPLSTGTLVHVALQNLLIACQDLGSLPSREFARELITRVIAEYKEELEKSGFVGEPSEQWFFIREEQACLAEGLFWGAYRRLIPWLFEQFDVLSVEQEESLVIGCTCGLGDGVGDVAVSGDQVLHEGRVCEGVCIMVRPDFSTRHKQTGAVAVWDFKTTSMEVDARGVQHQAQLYMGCLALERRLGEPVLDYYIVGLHKGQRKGDYNSQTRKYDGLKRQQSILCYAWWQPKSPPLMQASWSWETKRGGGWSKVPIWEGHFPEKSHDMTNIEHWVMDLLPDAVLADEIEVAGPFQRPQVVLDGMLRQMAAHTQEWAQRLGNLKEMAEAGALEAGLDLYFPQSWACIDKFKGSCPFILICWKRPGQTIEDDLLGPDSEWERRVPHHGLELTLRGGGKG